MMLGRTRCRRRMPLACLGAAVAVACIVGNARAQHWVDFRRAEPFICRAEFSLAEYDGLFRQLHRIQNDLVRCLGIPPATEAIELYLFRDKDSYARYVKQYLPGVPYRRALFVKADGPGRVYAYRSRDFEIDVRHECTHALLHGALPMVPLWLDEGLAEYFEVPAEQRAFDNPHLGSLRWNVRLGLVPRLSDLETMHDLSEMGKAEYRSSWAWVHFILHGSREAHAELVRYLRDIQRRTPPGTMSERLTQRVPQAQKQFAAHFKGWKR